MVVHQVQQRRKRRCGPKVTTGCGTCKVRRIKCDEAKPSCQRCSTTGRKCDGYSSDFMTASQKIENSVHLIKRISVHIPGNVEEKRGFDFFLHNTAPELSGYYDSSFWEQLILAASAQNPSLRHAIIAIGALHEGFSQNRLMHSRHVPSIPSMEYPKAEFAFNQYAKAIKVLRKSLSCGKEDPITALMSCILFVCFDSLQGWFDSAMIHLQSGLRILRDTRSSIGTQIIEDNIAPLLRRLSLQSIIYVDTMSTHDKTAFARDLTDVSCEEIDITEDFVNLEEARNALNQAADGLFRAQYMWDGDLPVFLQPTENLTTYDKYTSQLFLWDLAFERFMASKSANLIDKELRGAALLKIHHTTAKIMANVRPSMDDMSTVVRVIKVEDFLEYVDDFQIIINLSRPLVAAAEEDAKNGKPPLTFSSDLGLVGPLYYVCINCPSNSLRKRAMELLLRCPRHEGMWNSVMITQMIQQYWELEEKHKEMQDVETEEKVDEFGFPVPLKDTFDRGSVHFAFFGRPVINQTSVSHCNPPEPIISLTPLDTDVFGDSFVDAVPQLSKSNTIRRSQTSSRPP